MTTSTLPLAPARRAATALPAAAMMVFAVAEAAAALDVLRSHGALTARDAQTEVWIYAVAVAAIALVAIRDAGWTRRLAVVAPAVLAAGVLLVTATLGGQALAMVAAVLTMAAIWFSGRHLLRWLGAAQLADRAVVAWLAGLGPLCLLTLLLGRLSLLKWWTIGVVVVVFGALGCGRAARAMWVRRALIGSELFGSSISAVSAGVIALSIAATAIYTAAPEIQFDALYGKAYLPTLWAHTGTIGPLTDHIQLNIAGWFQLVATWGHLLGASATGRYMQLVGLGMAAAIVWSWGRRFGPLGPVAAAFLATTPALVWQGSTAYDDLLLAIAGFALTAAVFEALQPRFRAGDRATGVALGLMAGTGASLKTFLIPLCAALLAAWIVLGRRPATIVRRAAYGIVGAMITAGPPLILRWIDTGNPVFPAYNNIFKSPYWLPVNEHLNFPFWPNAGPLGPVKAVWDAVFHPSLMVEATPPGAYAVLVGAFLIVLLGGWWIRRRAGAPLLLWIAIVLATAVWWVEFRYLRYLWADIFAGGVLLLAATGNLRMTSARRRVAVAAVAVVGASSFAVAIAQFWNVPNHRLPISAAIGRWSASDYLEAALPERAALLEFNRLAPPHARVVTDAFERDWLTGGRDLYATWELAKLMGLHAPFPSSGDAAYSRARAMGVDWALVSGSDRSLSGSTWLPETLHTHGQLRFSAAGWDLYQLVERPSLPTPVSACDRVQTGVPKCWRIATAAGGGQVLTRVVRVCPGELISALVSQSSSGRPEPAFIDFIGAAPRYAFAPGLTAPGSTEPISGTVPAGAHEAVITVGPVAAGTVSGARLMRFGSGCQHSPGSNA